MDALEATLVVNSAYSRCSACGKNADPTEKSHLMARMEGEGCGALYVQLSSDYIGPQGLLDAVGKMRPDLPWVDPWDLLSV